MHFELCAWHIPTAFTKDPPFALDNSFQLSLPAEVCPFSPGFFPPTPTPHTLNPCAYPGHPRLHTKYHPPGPLEGVLEKVCEDSIIRQMSGTEETPNQQAVWKLVTDLFYCVNEIFFPLQDFEIVVKQKEAERQWMALKLKIRLSKS